MNYKIWRLRVKIILFAEFVKDYIFDRIYYCLHKDQIRIETKYLFIFKDNCYRTKMSEIYNDDNWLENMINDRNKYLGE